MILHLGFDVCVEVGNGHEAHCTIVQESGMESKPKKVIGRPRRAQLDQAWYLILSDVNRGRQRACWSP